MARFGTFEFDAGSGELRRIGSAAKSTIVRLEPQPAKALALLLSRAGEIVTRDDLKNALWPADTHVDFERGVAYCISQVRSALGDSADNPRFIETLPRRGFRFIAPVAPGPEGPGLQRQEGREFRRQEGTEFPKPEEAGLRIDERLAGPNETRPDDAKPRARSNRRLWSAALGAVALAIGAVAVYYLNQRPVLAVAIFDNETGQTALDGFTTGLSDALVAHLGQLDADQLGVVGNARALRMPRTFRDLDQIRETTGASHVILGQLQNTETGFRLIVHLIRLADGKHVWVRRFNRSSAIGELTGLEQEFLRETERGVNEHVLGHASASSPSPATR